MNWWRGGKQYFALLKFGLSGRNSRSSGPRIKSEDGFAEAKSQAAVGSSAVKLERAELVLLVTCAGMKVFLIINEFVR